MDLYQEQKEETKNSTEGMRPIETKGKCGKQAEWVHFSGFGVFLRFDSNGDGKKMTDCKHNI